MKKEEIQGRGKLTERIKVKSKELIGYEINQDELRLMVYIQYVVTNWHNISAVKINRLEQGYIDSWEESGYLSMRERFAPINKLYITKEFWSIICELIYLGYVDSID